MSVISVNHLTFYYEGSPDNVFEDVSFQIDTGWKLGFVARNGRGKTTLLRLLMGKYEYRGSIVSGVPFDYFPFEVTDVSQNTMDVVNGIFPENELWKICRELALLSVDDEVLYRPFCTLSGGERTKVMLAALFSRENRFLLIDEPTNHLDAGGRRTVREYLNGKPGFILVSHDRDFLDACVDHVLAINRTGFEVCQGNFSVWWENRKRRDAFEQAENEKRKKEIGRLEESAAQAGRWADDAERSKIGKGSAGVEKQIGTRAYIGEKSRRMQMRRKNLERQKSRAAEEMSALLKDVETAEALRLTPLTCRREVLVRMKDLCVCRGGRTFPALSLEIRNGDRVVLQGPNGGGKSSVIQALLQAAGFWDAAQPAGDGAAGTQTPSYGGLLETAGGLQISYVSQDAGFLKGFPAAFAEENGLDLPLFLALLRKLDFPRRQFEKRMEEYSGGQKKKVLLAASLCRPAHLYVWDEPLNFIDVFSRMQIEDLILKHRPTMLLAEHDAAFVDKVATNVIDYKEVR